MDHVIEYISSYMSSDTQEFINEWQSNKYNKLSECPSYGAVKAYCDARNILSKYCYGKTEYETPKQIIDNAARRD